MQLIDYLSVLRRHKGLVALAALLVTASTLVVAVSQTSVYQGKARLLLEGDQSPFDNNGSPRIDTNAVSTEIQVIQSQPVRSEVRHRIGAAPPVAALQVGATSVIEIRAES